MVTVTVSTDCWPVPVVMTNSPHCAVGHAGGCGCGDLCVAPSGNGGSFPTDGHGSGSLCSAKAIVAGDGPLIVGTCGSRGTGVTIVGHVHGAERLDGEGLRAGRADPRANSIAIDFRDGGRERGFGAIGMVVALGEGGSGHDRSIEI